MTKTLPRRPGPRHAAEWSSPVNATSAFRQKHRIDDVNDAVLLVDVGDRHEGLIALGVDDLESAAVLLDGQLLALDGLVAWPRRRLS